MKSTPSPPLPAILPSFLCLLLLLLASAAGTVRAQSPTSARIDPWVEEATRNGHEAEFLVLLRDQADLSPARHLPTKRQKGRFVFDALLAKARETQGPILRWLTSMGVEHRPYVIVNMIWVRAGWPVALALAARPEVALIEGNPRVFGLRNVASPATALGIEPGIIETNAPAVWAMGFTGQGVVVGGQDTGYQWDHPALINQYRGWNGTTADHDYNWHDSIHSGGGSCGADSPFPCGDHNHGTHTMGTAVGDDGGSNQIGMAPGAKWIGVRNMDQGVGTPATYIESFEFFLAPYPVGGTPQQGDPNLAPDVTVNSWACPPSEGCSYNSLLLAVQAQRAAGILTVAAAGNSGSSGCSSVDDPPALYDEVYTVGAYSASSGNLAGFSSRGPVAVDGSFRLKPDIAAPGVGIRSAIRNSGYQGGWSGTSMATPHVAGAVALLWSAHPALKDDLDLTEQVLNDTAVPISSNSCTSAGVPNNLWGHGKLDVLAAVQAVRGLGLSPANSSATAPPGTPVVHILTVTNTGYLQDSFTVSAAGTFAVTVLDPTVGPLAPGASADVTLVVQIPPGASAGTSDLTQVTAVSQAFPLADAQATLTTVVVGSAPTLAITQPGGPGQPVFITSGNLFPGAEVFNVLSVEPCPGGPGTGPFLGLCASDPNTLFSQVALPLGFQPFHFLATGPSATFGPYPAPAGLVVEGVCFILTGSGISGVSAVSSLTVN